MFQSDVTSPFLHDAVVLFGKLAREVFLLGKDFRNGSELVEHVKNKHYENDGNRIYFVFYLLLFIVKAGFF